MKPHAGSADTAASGADQRQPGQLGGPALLEEASSTDDDEEEDDIGGFGERAAGGGGDGRARTKTIELTPADAAAPPNAEARARWKVAVDGAAAGQSAPQLDIGGVAAAARRGALKSGWLQVQLDSTSMITDVPHKIVRLASAAARLECPARHCNFSALNSRLASGAARRRRRPPRSARRRGARRCVVPFCNSGHQLVRVGWGRCP